MPVVKEGEMINLTKCAVNYQEEECSHTALSTPRLGCPRQITDIRNIYTG